MKNNHYLNGWGIAVCLLFFSFSLFSQFTYECPPNISQYQEEKSIQLISGTIEMGTSADLSTENCLNVGAVNAYYWTTIPITVENTDRFMFEIDGLAENGIIAIYQNGFSVANYCNNLLATGRLLNANEGYDNFSSMPSQQASALLTAGENYTLLIANIAGDIPFEIAAYSTNGGSLNGFPANNGIILNDLITVSADSFRITNGTLTYLWDGEGATIIGSISDEEQYERLRRGGLPILTSTCASNNVSASSQYTQNGDCGHITVTQTVSILEDSEDSCNLNPAQTAGCQQIITFRPPSLNDLTLPNKIVNLIGSTDYLLDEEYRPHPLHTGYPFFNNLQKTYLLAETAANMAANYTDDTSVLGVVRRHWSLQNWCEPGQFIDFLQTILVDPPTGLEVTCPANLSQLNLTGTIQAYAYPNLSTDQVMDAADLSCLSDEQGDIYYKTYTFSASQAGYYVFEISSLSENGLVAIYQNEPTAGNYCDHILAISQALPPGTGYSNFDISAPTSRVAPYLNTGQNYTLLVADNIIDNSPPQAVVYALDDGIINGFFQIPGTIVNDITYGHFGDLLIQGTLSYQSNILGETIASSISDEESYQSMVITGFPTLQSDCNLNGVSLFDAITTDGDCGDITIDRHFEITEDSEGNCNFSTPQQATCDQVITFRQFSMIDVFLPNQTVDLGCSAYPVDAEGHPAPYLTGYPFILNGKEKYDLMENAFNLAANYTDDTSIPGKIIREWVIFSWCEPNSHITFYQTLLIDGDNEISLDCPDNTGQIHITSPVQEMNTTVVVGQNEIDFTDTPCLPAAFHDEYATQITEISVDAADRYIFEVAGLAANDFTAIYRSSIDIDMPCTEMIAVSKSSPNYTGFFSNSSSTQRFSATLAAGQTYYLLTASLNTADISWAIHSKNGGQLIGLQSEDAPIVLDLIRQDIPQLAITSPQSYLVNNVGEVEIGSISAELKTILDYTGYPVISSLIGNNQITVSDEIIFAGDCEDVSIHRTFLVEEVIITDNCLDLPVTKSCVQVITFRREQVKDIFWPVVTQTFHCNDFFETDEDGLPLVNETDYPFFASAFHEVSIDDTYTGNILNNYTYYDVTDNSMRRQWAVVNECSFADNGFFNQLITIDQAAPILVCLGVNHDSGITHYSLNNDNCTANIEIPIPPYPGQCPTFFNIRVEVFHILADGSDENIFSVQNPENVVLENLALGYYYFRYIANDQNNNFTTLDCPFIVQDNTPPVPICDDNLHISIGGSGLARVYAEDIDEGSYDACGDDGIEVRRDGIDTWQAYVDFHCSDVNTEVNVFLRVWDDANNSGTFGDTIAITYPNGYSELYPDNYSTCSITVLVEDKINPFCYAPSNDNIHCDDELLNNIDFYDIDVMNTLFGTPIATDNCTATAQQVSINVNLADCGQGVIIRTFSAMDTWGSISLNNCLQKIYIYEIHDYYVKFPADETIACGGEPVNVVQFENDGCSELTYTYTDELGGTSNEGCRIIERTHSIINTCIYDGVSPAVIVGRDEDADGNPGDENIYVISETVFNGSNPIGPIIYFSRYSDPDDIHWTSSIINPELGGINYFQYTQFLYLEGGDAPTIDYPDAGSAICLGDDPCDLSGLPYFVVHPTCPVELVDIHVYFDKDNDGSIDAEAVVFELDVAENGDIEVVYIPTVTELGTYNVIVSATDVCGSEGTFSFITSVDNCDGLQLSGEIATQNEVVIENVTVFINSQAGSSNVSSNEEGLYEVCTLSEGSSFVVQPHLNTNHAEGLTTLDVVRVYKHILGINEITNPYNLIAADVNNSGSVTAMDALDIQKLLLGQIDVFTNNTSWRFVDKNYQFSSNNPLEENFPESILFENYAGSTSDVDFVAIKIGDVDGSFMPFTSEIETTERSHKTIHLGSSDIDFQAGEIFAVEITVEGAQEIEGIQGTLGFDSDALTLLGNQNIEKGAIPFSWTIFQEDKSVLQLSFQAKKEGKLSDFVQLNSRALPLFAFDKAAVSHPVALVFSAQNEPKNTLAWVNNYPNPFSTRTVISFELEKNETVNLLIQNVQGIIIKTMEIEGFIGQNDISLYAKDFPASGVYFYTLLVNDKHIVKKIVFNQ